MRPWLCVCDIGQTGRVMCVCQVVWHGRLGTWPESLMPERTFSCRRGTSARAGVTVFVPPPVAGAEMWDSPPRESGTNRSGNCGNFGASTALICSVDAVYDWASFIIRPPASAWELANRVLAFVTAESDGPPP